MILDKFITLTKTHQLKLEGSIKMKATKNVMPFIVEGALRVRATRKTQ